jgi:hypothetical protein
MDASFFDEVNEIIQEEPNTAMDPEEDPDPCGSSG